MCGDERKERIDRDYDKINFQKDGRRGEICEPRRDTDASRTRITKVPTLTVTRRRALVRVVSEPRAKTSRIISSMSVFRRYLASRYHSSRVNVANAAHMSNVGME